MNITSYAASIPIDMPHVQKTVSSPVAVVGDAPPSASFTLTTKQGKKDAEIRQLLKKQDVWLNNRLKEAGIFMNKASMELMKSQQDLSVVEGVLQNVVAVRQTICDSYLKVFSAIQELATGKNATQAKYRNGFEQANHELHKAQYLLNFFCGQQYKEKFDKNNEELIDAQSPDKKDAPDPHVFAKAMTNAHAASLHFSQALTALFSLPPKLHFQGLWIYDGEAEFLNNSKPVAQGVCETVHLVSELWTETLNQHDKYLETGPEKEFRELTDKLHGQLVTEQSTANRKKLFELVNGLYHHYDRTWTDLNAFKERLETAREFINRKDEALDKEYRDGFNSKIQATISELDSTGMKHVRDMLVTSSLAMALMENTPLLQSPILFDAHKQVYTNVNALKDVLDQYIKANAFQAWRTEPNNPLNMEIALRNGWIEEKETDDGGIDFVEVEDAWPPSKHWTQEAVYSLARGLASIYKESAHHVEAFVNGFEDYHLASNDSEAVTVKMLRDFVYLLSESAGHLYREMTRSGERLRETGIDPMALEITPDELSLADKIKWDLFIIEDDEDEEDDENEDLSVDETKALTETIQASPLPSDPIQDTLSKDSTTTPFAPSASQKKTTKVSVSPEKVLQSAATVDDVKLQRQATKMDEQSRIWISKATAIEEELNRRVKQWQNGARDPHNILDPRHSARALHDNLLKAAQCKTRQADIYTKLAGKWGTLPANPQTTAKMAQHKQDAKKCVKRANELRDRVEKKLIKWVMELPTHVGIDHLFERDLIVSVDQPRLIQIWRRDENNEVIIDPVTGKPELDWAHTYKITAKGGLSCEYHLHYDSKDAVPLETRGRWGHFKNARQAGQGSQREILERDHTGKAVLTYRGPAFQTDAPLYQLLARLPPDKRVAVAAAERRERA